MFGFVAVLGFFGFYCERRDGVISMIAATQLVFAGSLYQRKYPTLHSLRLPLAST
jgi:hypothetical protein